MTRPTRPTTDVGPGTTAAPGADPAEDLDANPDRAPYRTTAESRALGRAARARAPRSVLGAWEPAPDRPDPVAILEDQAASRVRDLVPVRYGRMLASPFAFYRGAAAVMAADLAPLPTSGLRTQVCGDAHLANFGLFGSPERALVFDLNDFDETLPGPWEWDVRRLLASLEIAGRANGFRARERREVVRRSAAAYRAAVHELAGRGTLEVWYSHNHVEEGLPRLRALLDRKDVGRAEKVVRQALHRDTAHAVTRLTEVVDGRRRIRSEPPLVVPVEDVAGPDLADRLGVWMEVLLEEYRRSLPPDRAHLLGAFRPVHLARKVVGVGSVGTRAWIMLLVGRDDDDLLLLQAKEAQASVLEAHVAPAAQPGHAQRVVEGQRLMQAVGDIFLGWVRTPGVDGVSRDFYVRQLRDWKGSWDPAVMNPAVMTVYGELCAATLARAHARSGDRVALAAYLGSSDRFEDELPAFAAAYADQNERDHAALQAAVRAGRVEARTGV